MKIALGTGKIKHDGYINCDIDPSQYPDRIVDVRQPLPFDDESCLEVLCENLFDSLTRPEFVGLMREIWRVLECGGVLNFLQCNSLRNMEDQLAFPYCQSLYTAKTFKFFDKDQHEHKEWVEIYNLPAFHSLKISHNESGIMTGQLTK